MTKKCLVFVAAVLFAWGTSAIPASAAASGTVPDGLRKNLHTALSKLEKESSEEHVFIGKMKKAGASYFPELAAPPEKAKNYQDKESQRMMAGVYLLDMSYAIVFEKKKDSLKYGEAINDLLGKLGFSDEKIVEQYKKAVKELDKPDAKKLFTKLDRLIEESWRGILHTPDGLDLAVDAAYGWFVELMYLTTEIVAQKDYDPKFIKLLNDQKKTAQGMIRVLDVFKDNPDLGKIVEREERLPLLKEITKQLKIPGKVGKKEVEAIRALVAKERAAIVK